MVIELKSVFRNPKLRLALKALVFAGLLCLVKVMGFDFWAVLLFIVGSLVLYAKPLFRTLDLIWPFLVLLVLALIAVWTLLESGYWFLPVIYFSVLFYLVFGIKDLAFVGRANWNQILVLGLVYPALLLFFYHNQDFFWWKVPVLFLTMLIIFRYLLRQRVVFWLLAFLTLEAAWAISLLPIGFLSSANLGIIFYFALTDPAFHYYVAGDLKKKRLLTDITVAALLILLVLAFSRWGL